MKKKRPPIEQLKEAGRIARQMLIDRGLEGKESRIKEILESASAAVLPGIPAYLPHRHTIKIAQRVMRDLIVEWMSLTKKDEKRRDNITEFFKFVVGRMREEERKHNKEMAKQPKLLKSLKMVPVLKDVFSPMRKKESTRGIHHFFVDSFAVAIILKNNHSTSEYAHWFLDWTEELHAMWEPKEKRAQNKKI